MKLGEKIKEQRLLKKMTMDTLAKQAGISKGYVSMLEKGINPNTKKTLIPSLDKVQNIAKALNIELDVLLKDTNDLINLDSTNTLTHTLPTNTTIIKITENASKLTTENQNKTLDFTEKLLEEEKNSIMEEKEPYVLTKICYTEKVSAGTGYSYGDNEQEYVYTDRDDLPAYDFATMVSGDSMIPDYNFGDIVLVRQGYDNINGDVYVIDYDGESYVKKVFNHGTHFILRSINEEYKDIIIYLSDLEDKYFNIVGKVIDSFTPVER